MSRKNTFAVCAMAFVLLMLGIRVWTGAERQVLYSLLQIEQAPDGRVFVVLGDRLFIENPDGTADAMIPLARFGVRQFHGDLAVLSDGSVILARGQLPDTTFEESALATAGLANEDNTPSDPLMRCSPDTFACVPLDGGGEAARIGRTFMLAVDEDASALVVTDTSRARVLLLDLSGRVLDREVRSFRFPNQVQRVAPGEVIIADGWHDRFVRFRYADGQFGALDTVTDTACWPASAVRGRPTGFQQLPGGSRWAVSGLDLDFGGGLYRLDAECATAIETSPTADLTFLAAAGDTILVPDAEAFRIWRFDAYGAPLADFGSPELQAALAADRSRKRWVTIAFDWSLWLLLLAAVPMIYLGRKINEHDEATAAAGEAVAGDAPAPASEPAARTAHEILTPSEQLRRLRGEYLFRRRLLPLNSSDAFRVFSLMSVLGYAFWAAYLWMTVVGREWEGVPTLLLHNNTFLATTALTIVSLVGGWLVLHYERVRIDREGIRYQSMLNGPLRFLNALHPDWQVRWADVEHAELRHTGDGNRPGEWVFVVRDRAGVDRVLKALFWRLDGRADGGVGWSSLVGLSSKARCVAGAKETWLYRLLAFRGAAA